MLLYLDRIIATHLNTPLLLRLKVHFSLQLRLVNHKAPIYIHYQWRLCDRTVRLIFMWSTEVFSVNQQTCNSLFIKISVEESVLDALRSSLFQCLFIQTYCSELEKHMISAHINWFVSVAFKESRHLFLCKMFWRKRLYLTPCIIEWTIFLIYCGQKIGTIYVYS